MNIHSIRDAGRLCCLVTTSLVVGLFFSKRQVHAAGTPSKAQQLDYHFDGTISREVLENYLDRSVTMAYFLVTGKVEGNREYLYREDDARLIRNIGAKFIGRAIYRANTRSPNCPIGYSQEETIKKIWSNARK